MPRTTYYPPRGEVLPVALFQAPDGRPMQANLVEIRIVRPEGTEVIPPRTVIDGNSSPLWPKEGRRAAWPHDIRFRYGRGLLAANRAFYQDMREWDGRGPILAGLFWLGLTLFPFAYIRHKLRIRYGWKWLKKDEDRWIPPESTKAMVAALKMAEKQQTSS